MLGKSYVASREKGWDERHILVLGNFIHVFLG